MPGPPFAALLCLGLCLSACSTARGEAPPATSPAEAPAGAAPAPLLDLTKIAGLDKYTGPEAGQPLLAQRGLLISPETRPQLFQFYCGGELPYFITTDTALHAYGVIFEKGFKELEGRQAETLAGFQGRMWLTLAGGDDTTSHMFAKQQAQWPVALQAPAATMVAVAAKLLNPEWQPETDEGRQLYDHIAKDVEAELQRIEAGQPAKSPLFGATVDYSLLKPRGFYAGDPALEYYFKARGFWAMPMNLDDNRVLQTAVVLGALCEGYEYGERLTAPVKELVGSPNLPAAVTVARKLGLAGRDQDVESFKRLSETSAAAEARKKLMAELPVPLVPIGADLRQVFEGASATPQKRPLWTAMWPQVALPDAAMMTRCIWPNVPELRHPGGLDVLACCGHDRALELLLAAEPEANRKPLEAIIRDTREKRHRLCTEDHADDPWTAPLRADEPRAMVDLEDLRCAQVWGGLDRVFETLREPGLTRSHPKFMSTTAYADKSLNAALSAWATYRHTFALHSVNMGYLGGGEPEPPPAYVEPNPRFWTTLRDVAIQNYLWLHEHGADAPQMIELAQLCARAGTIAEKQLAGQELSTGDQNWLRNFGKRLAELCGYYTNLPSTVEEECGIVADIASDRLGDNALYVATARPRAIYVVMDYGGRLQLARGGVTSYREFLRPLAEGRLTDSQWQDLLKANQEPPAPQWLAALGADYTAEDVRAAAKEGRINRDVLRRYASKEILAALMDYCATQEGKHNEYQWPPNCPDWILAGLMAEHPELLDRPFMERYLVSAEKYDWRVDLLPRKAEWVDLYIALVDRLTKVDQQEGEAGRHFRQEQLAEQLAVVIGQTDAPPARQWLKAVLDGAWRQPTELVACLESYCGHQLPEATRIMITDIFLPILERPAEKPAAAEAPPERFPAAFVARRLGEWWPYWTTQYDPQEPLSYRRGPVVAYSPQAAAVRAKVVAALKKFAARTASQDDLWDDTELLEAFTNCLGAEALQTPLAEKIRKSERAMSFASPDEK